MPERVRAPGWAWCRGGRRCRGGCRRRWHWRRDRRRYWNRHRHRADHGERVRAHPVDPVGPAAAEGAPRGEPVQEGKPLVTDLLDERAGIHARGSRGRLRTDLAVDIGPDKALKHLGGAGDARIHPIVEYRVIDASRKIVGGKRSPIFLVIDREHLILRSLPHIGRQARMDASPVIPFALNHFARGASAGIARIIIIAAFVLEHQRHTIGKALGRRPGWRRHRHGLRRCTIAPITLGRRIPISEFLEKFVSLT